MSDAVVTSTGNFIGGEWIAGAGEAMHSVDLMTGQLVWQGSALSAAQVSEACAVAAAAQSAWGQRSAQDRQAICEQFAAIVERDREELAQLISLETGKPQWEATQEAGAVIAKLAASIKAWEAEQQPTTALGAATAVVRQRPIGPVVVLGPFNLPAHLPNGQILPALLAGNTILFKPSERTPACGLFLVRALHEAGVPAGVIACLQGGPEVGKALVAAPAIAGVFFTGSARGGEALHQALAGRPQVQLMLEMGGNNPLVVWEPDDLQAAVRQIILSAYITGGQRCTCARRLIIPDDARGQQILDALVPALEHIRVGHHSDRPEPFMGPVVDARASQALLLAQNELQDKGATVLRASRAGSHAQLLGPGLIDLAGLPLGDDEIFGPMLFVRRVADFAAALREANATSYGLSAGLLDSSPERWQEFVVGVQAGIINWNRQTTGASGALPFGGVGRSGNHRPAGFSVIKACYDPVASLEQTELPVPGEQPGLDPGDGAGP